MILYPTETIYGLGVNVFDDAELDALFELKGRDESQTASWIVRDIADIAYYGELSETAAEIAKRFLPGSLTLVLPAKNTVPSQRAGPDNTIGIRISPDPVAQAVIAKFMAEYDAPLTCTSANVSGLATLETPEEILKQFGERAVVIDEVVDDGPRSGAPSTVVRVIGDQVDILREGAVPESEISELFK